jgi:hypothetical protein
LKSETLPVYEELTILRATVPIRRRSVTVLTPEHPIRRLFVTARANGEWSIFGDLPALHQMALWSSLASELEDTIVWIPRSEDRNRHASEEFETCDLVFWPRTLQLKTSEWKNARSYFKSPERLKRTVQLPNVSFAVPRESYRSKSAPGDDVADFSQHAGTVFVVASSRIYRHMGSVFAWLDGAEKTGAHGHLFSLARHGRSDRGDLLMCFVADEDWE